MPHKYFTEKSKDFYKIKILTNLEFNDNSVSLSELNSFTKVALKIMSSGTNPLYKNIDLKKNIMYRCKY